jgi:drug/metabolite transporter (DMT)-like permease
MVLAGSLIALLPDFGAIPIVVLIPFLWAFYFLIIPRIQRRKVKIASAVIILSAHWISGILLAIEDPAFGRSLTEEPTQLATYGLLLALTMSLLVYFAMRDPAARSSNGTN